MGVRKRDEERELSRKEIRKAIAGLREAKAVGIDGIPGEIWKYGGEDIKVLAWGFCYKIWKGEGWPEGWIEGAIVPIIKKALQGGYDNAIIV